MSILSKGTYLTISRSSLPLLGSQIQPVMPMYKPRSRNFFNSFLSPVKQWTILWGTSLIVFPEGTRKIPGKKVGKFAGSAADLAIKNNIDLIPIYHDSGLYWKNKKFIKFPGTVKVIIGAPIKGKNSSEMTKNLVDWMNKKASMSTE